jgi:hypothetical protein
MMILKMKVMMLLGCQGNSFVEVQNGLDRKMRRKRGSSTSTRTNRLVLQTTKFLCLNLIEGTSGSYCKET